MNIKSSFKFNQPPQRPSK